MDAHATRTTGPADAFAGDAPYERRGEPAGTNCDLDLMLTMGVGPAGAIACGVALQLIDDAAPARPRSIISMPPAQAREFGLRLIRLAQDAEACQHVAGMLRDWVGVPQHEIQAMVASMRDYLALKTREEVAAGGL